MWPFKRKRYIRIRNNGNVIKEWLIIKESDKAYHVKETKSSIKDVLGLEPIAMWIEKRDQAIVDVDGVKPIVEHKDNVILLAARRR